MKTNQITAILQQPFGTLKTFLPMNVYSTLLLQVLKFHYHV